MNWRLRNWRCKRQPTILYCADSGDSSGRIYILKTASLSPDAVPHEYDAADEQCRLRLQSRGVAAAVVDTVPEACPHYRRAPDPGRSEQPRR